MEALTKEQVKSVIEGRGCAQRVPMTYHTWIYPGVFGERQAELRRLLDSHPNDIETRDMNLPPVFITEESPDFSWVKKHHDSLSATALDACIALEDWDELETVLADFPNPQDVRICTPCGENAQKYTLARWWYCFFERLWSLRGMENALTDFYLYPDEVHRLFQKLTDFYSVLIERAHDELHADGIFTSDDIGTQTNSFFSLSLFHEFFKPYYQQLIEKAHSLGMHFWLHTCGNIEAFLPEFIGIGLDVIHPIQKYTMDERSIAQKYGQSICIWAGFDVQQIIPYGTPEEVRTEARALLDVYFRKDGRLMMTMGNGSTPDWPVESIQALLEETETYSAKLAAEKA